MVIIFCSVFINVHFGFKFVSVSLLMKIFNEFILTLLTYNVFEIYYDKMILLKKPICKRLSIISLFSSVEQRMTACSRKSLSPTANDDL